MPEKAKADCGGRIQTCVWKVSTDQRADQRADQSKRSLWAGDKPMIEILIQGCLNIDSARRPQHGNIKECMGCSRS